MNIPVICKTSIPPSTINPFSSFLVGVLKSFIAGINDLGGLLFNLTLDILEPNHTIKNPVKNNDIQSANFSLWIINSVTDLITFSHQKMVFRDINNGYCPSV